MQIQLTPSWVLTTDHSSSSYGSAVLVNRHNDEQAYGPADVVKFPLGSGGVQPAAFFVARYGARLEGEERDAAARFLRQWPGGPQLED